MTIRWVLFCSSVLIACSPFAVSAQTCSMATTVTLSDSVILDHDRLIEPLSHHATAAEQQQLLGNVRALMRQLHLECGYQFHVDVMFYPDVRMYGLRVVISHGEDRGVLQCHADMVAVPFVTGTLPEHGYMGGTHRLPRGMNPLEASEDALQHGQRICGVTPAL